MDTTRVTKSIGFFMLAIVLSTIAMASEIYHWVDENGVSNFSQYRPASNTPDVNTLKLETSKPPGNDQYEDVYNVEAHEKRMIAWRAERQNTREDSRERKRQASQQPQIQYVQAQSQYWYPRPYYSYRPPYKPHPPIEKPRPPIEKPRPPSILPRPISPN